LALADPVKVYNSMLTMTADPVGTVTWLRDRLQPIQEADAGRLTRLLADLDDEKSEVRAKAKEALAEMGTGAETALRKARENPRSVEVRRSLDELLGRLASQQAQGLRAIEVLEHIGSPQAQALLERLSHGAPGAALTREAQTSLRRLNTRSVKGR
jgi:hypothetical protein